MRAGSFRPVPVHRCSRARIRAAAGGLLVAGLALALSACGTESGSSETDGGTGGTGGTGDTGDTGNTGGPGDPAILVGSFQVQLVAPVPASGNTPASDGKTSLVGKIFDGPSPAALIWETGTQAGDCRLLTPRVPFCSTPCGGSAVCVEDETCEPYPMAGSAGTITAKGIKTTAGASGFAMEAIANNYQPPAGVTLAYPAFAEGDEVSLSASGDTFVAFDVSARGIRPLELTNQTIALVADQPVTLTWTPAADVDASKIHVKLDISHHGGTKGKIECEVADSGSLELDGGLIGELLDLGVAGFPSIIVTRKATGSTTIVEGRVDLVLSSAVERFVTIEGLTSCTGDTDCPDGQTCQEDLTCQ